MKRKPLFPQISGIMHGGDYNPEQWLDRPDILEEDIRLMKKAGMTSATLGVFSWSVYEPREGEYHFDWLIEIMDRLYENGIYTILSTPSGGKPVWLSKKYQEVLRVGKDGRREHQGIRENHCMTSPIYRKKVHAVLEQLVARVKNHPGLLMWHISNEFGGECYCPLCQAKFQEYLSDKFDGDIENVNKAWWTTFWSHRYTGFDEIEPPFSNGETSIMGLNLEWKRFTTWSMTDYMKSEITYLRQQTPNLPITTNYMMLYPGLDYRVMSKELDVISWDSYPRFHTDKETLTQTFARNAFDHAVMRSMKKDRPFMLMESAPGLVNWHDFNKLRRPGIHRLGSFQAVACGSDTVQYFQWRKGRGSFEQYHGAVLDHLGTDDTRIFREVASLGEELGRLGEICGTVPRAKVALIFEWDTMWAIEDMKGMADETKQYDMTCIRLYRDLMKFGVDIDVISTEDELSDYKLIVAPMLYLLKDGIEDKLAAFVKDGGILMGTYASGYVDENQLCYLGGFPGGVLKDVYGIISEEIDTLYPSDENAVIFVDGTRGIVKDYAELLRVGTAEVIGTYESDFYAGMAAVTRNKYGDGRAYYVAARIDEEAQTRLCKMLLEEAGLNPRQLPDGIEVHTREAEGDKYTFYMNTTNETKCVEAVTGTNLLDDTVVAGKLELEPLGLAIVKSVS